MTTTPAHFSRLLSQFSAFEATGTAASGLDSLDLLQLEPLLCAGLQKFFNFKGYTLHFPLVKDNEDEAQSAEYLPGERKLLLPLRRGGRLLGVFVAREVPPAVKKMLPLLPGLAELCLENIYLYKQGLRDPLSGLLRRDHFLNLVGHELEQIREALRPGGLASAGVPACRFGLMVIRLNNLAAQVREHGYLRVEKLIGALAAQLEQSKPGQATAARSGEAEFALLLPALAPQACRELGLELVKKLNSVNVLNELNGRKLRISASAGFVDCPRDLAGRERHPAQEQARRLLRRARLTAAMAMQNSLAGSSGLSAGQGNAEALPVLAYGGILREGGRVLQVLPLSRLEVSLGKYCGARPGQRFTLWGYALEDGRRPVRRYKGEVLLVQVRHNDSTAELLYCDDPSLLPENGDQLILAGQENLPSLYPADLAAALPGSEARPAQKLDPGTGFLLYSDFLPLWCREREKYEQSSLILARFALPTPANGEALPQAALLLQEEAGDEAGDDLPEAFGDNPPLAPVASGTSAAPLATAAAGNGPNSGQNSASNSGQNGDSNGGEFYDRQAWEERLAFCARRFREVFGPLALYGRYGLNSFVAFVPQTAESASLNLKSQVESLSREFAAQGLHSAFGLAPHPYLDFAKGEALENAHKALEYALLLPWPHVGELDSLALNISADRRYSLGDQLGAISEYKKALLSDENNILAWNSLGVTLAGLGRFNEARRHFKEALNRQPDDVPTLYNLGQLCQSGGEFVEALSIFQRCRALAPDNIYILYRLGQLAEQQGDNAQARSYYRQAAELPGGEALTRRGLARLAIKEGRLEEAREELHEALLINPNDALALQMLAGLYLDAGENPAVAESLARQSAALRPDFKAAWLELARALEACGKAQDAREALLKAGEL